MDFLFFGGFNSQKRHLHKRHRQQRQAHARSSFYNPASSLLEKICKHVLNHGCNCQLKPPTGTKGVRLCDIVDRFKLQLHRCLSHHDRLGHSEVDGNRPGFIAVVGRPVICDDRRTTHLPTPTHGEPVPGLDGGGRGITVTGSADVPQMLGEDSCASPFSHDPGKASRAQLKLILTQNIIGVCRSLHGGPKAPHVTFFGLGTRVESHQLTVAKAKLFIKTSFPQIKIGLPDQRNAGANQKVPPVSKLEGKDRLKI